MCLSDIVLIAMIVQILKNTRKNGSCTMLYFPILIIKFLNIFIISINDLLDVIRDFRIPVIKALMYLSSVLLYSHLLNCILLFHIVMC